MIEIVAHTRGGEAIKNFSPMQPGCVKQTYADFEDLEQAIGFTHHPNRGFVAIFQVVQGSGMRAKMTFGRRQVTMVAKRRLYPISGWAVWRTRVSQKTESDATTIRQALSVIKSVKNRSVGRMKSAANLEYRVALPVGGQPPIYPDGCGSV